MGASFAASRPYGVGHRMPIQHTRSILRAALMGALDQVPTRPDPIFGLAVPTLCPDVPADVLDPRCTWLDPQAYDAQARRLADLFAANIRKFGDAVPDDVRKAGPARQVKNSCCCAGISTELRTVGRFMLLGLLLAYLFAFAQQSLAMFQGETQSDVSRTDKSADTIQALQKTTQNTVATVMSIPVENIGNFNMGPYDRNQDVVFVKPLIPIQLSENWRLILRTLQPVRWQPYVSRNRGGEFGLGDMNPTFFLSPRSRGMLAWGVGPTFLLPTATDRTLGQGKFSVGPEFALFVQPGHWTFGTLISNVWSVAGSSGHPNVNQMQFQYFITYCLKRGWDLETSPIVAANWKGRTGNVWTVPFGGGVGKIVHFGSRPAKLSAQLYRTAVSPSGAAPWSMRVQTEFLFPKRKQQEN